MGMVICPMEGMDIGFRYVIPLVRLFVNLIVCRPCELGYNLTRSKNDLCFATCIMHMP